MVAIQLTMLCQYGGSRMQEDMQTISQQLKFFRNKVREHHDWILPISVLT